VMSSSRAFTIWPARIGTRREFRTCCMGDQEEHRWPWQNRTVT
jgi:hypothetical protein